MKATSEEDTAGEQINATIKVGQTTVQITHPDRLYWPGEGITKGDLVKYYESVADVMLPYLKDRPQSLHRFPNGIADEGFYQKDVGKNVMPLWVRTEIMPAPSAGKTIDYLVCDDKATLLYMANMGCIEIHPWSSRTANPERPDWLVIDLDPEEIGFDSVVQVALETKRIFDELELDCYCKTSGATGLHIFMPLNAEYDYEVVRSFAHLVARLVHETLPDITSLERSPANRKQKVYIDFLQNSKGQTLAAPYSVRPKPGAPVSTPLAWEEVNERLDPAAFNISNTLARIEKKGDLWEPVRGKGMRLEKALEKLAVPPDPSEGK